MARTATSQTLPVFPRGTRSESKLLHQIGRETKPSGSVDPPADTANRRDGDGGGIEGTGPPARSSGRSRNAKRQVEASR
jgi:hypothetical protein